MSSPLAALSPVYVRHHGPPPANNNNNNNRKLSRVEGDRKIYEQLYGVSGGAGRRGRTEQEEDNPKKNQKGNKNRKESKAKKGNSNKQPGNENVELDNWTVEPFGIYGHYEPKYISAQNLREGQSAMDMQMQYQHHLHHHQQQQQHVMPNYYDYYYFDRGYGQVPPRPFDPSVFPGVSQHGKWASDQDIFGTLERIKKTKQEAVAGRRGEFRFNPAIFNGQMFRNANMKYSTESGETESSGEEGEGEEEEEENENNPAVDDQRENENTRRTVAMKSVSEDSIDQLSMNNVDNSALVNFMRANNEIVNHEFDASYNQNNNNNNNGNFNHRNKSAHSVATRTTNIRYVTKVYVPRKQQQQEQQEQQDLKKKKLSQIPQPKKSVSIDSFFNDLDRIDIDEEQYEREKMRIEEHLEMLKEHSIKDYDSHDRKKLLTRSQSHSVVMDEGSAANSKLKLPQSPLSKVPVSRRLSLTVKPDLGLSRKMAEEMNNRKTTTTVVTVEKEQQQQQRLEAEEAAVAAIEKENKKREEVQGNNGSKKPPPPPLSNQ